MAGPVLPFLEAIDKADRRNPALCNDGNSWIDYGTLRTQVHALRESFAASAKRLVLCLLPPTVEAVAAYLAAAASGHAVMVLDATAKHLPELLAAYKPDWVVAPAAVRLDGYVAQEWGLAAMRLWRVTVAEPSDIHPDLFLLLLTSGSTGGVKAVRLSYANLAHNTAAIIQSLDLTAATRALLHLPLAYSFGLSVLHTVLAAEGSVVLTAAAMTGRDFWETARRQAVNLFPGVPYHFQTLARLGLDRLQIPALKTLIQAGGKLDEATARDLLRQIQERNGEFFMMYGQTEASPRMSCLPLHLQQEKIGSVGKALADGYFLLQDDEIIYEGPNVMMGYAQRRGDLALGDTQRGQLATGDSGVIADDGSLTITGRQSRFSKILGQRIALDALETVVNAVAPAAVFAKDDGIVVVTATVEFVKLERMKQTLAAQTSLPPACFAFRSVEALPYLPNGKIDYRAMERLL